MLRSHNCGQLRINNANEIVTLCGWVQRVRNKGGIIWVDLRDRYGITQLIFDEGKTATHIMKQAEKLGRECVIRAQGIVVERLSKNDNIPTGDIEIFVENLTVLNEAKTPPFTIEDNTDGGEDLRMKYRYLDLRRNTIREKLMLRHNLLQATRRLLDYEGFIEVETPVLIKSTPEGARDFVVPSRINTGEFYALPQSPQTFKQLLMVSGFDKYFQIVKCFRDEDLRADRQPEFTQIDCEMTFVERDDILNTFENLIRSLFKEVKGIDLQKFERMTYAEAMKNYGSDKPDIRFGMKFYELKSKDKSIDLTSGKGFKVFDTAEVVIGISAKGCASYTRKELDQLTEWVKRPQIGAKGLVYVKCNEDGTFKSSIDKFYDQESLASWANEMNAKKGDLLLILSGSETETRKALSELRLEMGNRLGYRKKDIFAPLWVIDFPVLEWNEESHRFFAMHHPFTSVIPEDREKLKTNPGSARANAYDMVINGVELGGGSIRIHHKKDQEAMFEALGFSEEEAKAQFGFLLDAFEYGAPPHGGIAFGFDRLCALLGGSDSIRDYIAFPKNNAGRDVMIDSPAHISPWQLKELGLKLNS